MRDVAFSCDDNGVRFLKVAVYSLLSHYHSSEALRINVFDGFGGHSEAHREEMRALVARFPNATLRYINAEPAVEPYRDLILNREKSRWNVFTWTPIFTPQLLPDATGNIIHFDIDMLFNADISPLFEMVLGDNLIACCHEYDKYGDNAGKVIWKNGILPPSEERYFNTGVLVFNAAACRAERTWEKIIAWYRAHYAIAERIEQDAWNALYHDRMMPLNVKWNFHDRAIKNYVHWPLDAKYWLGNSPRDCLTAALNPALLHFWGPKKPWKVSHRPYRKLYHAAMRAVDQKPPREPLIAPYYNLINAWNRRRLAERLHELNDPNWPNWKKRLRKKAIKHAFEAPFEWLAILMGLIILMPMPHHLLMSLCDVLSVLYFHFDRTGRRRALETLRIIRRNCHGLEGTPKFDPDCEPYDATPRENCIIRRSYRNMSRTIGHIFWTSLFPRRRVKSVGKMDAPSRAFLQNHKPAITVSGHIGCWEILSQLAFLEGHTMMSVAKRIGTSGMTRLLMRARKAIGQEIVSAEGAFKSLMAGLRSGKSLGLLVDQSVDPETDGGLWIKFLGRPMPVSAAPAFFAAKVKVPIIIAWSHPLHDGTYRCEKIDEITPTAARDIRGTTQRIANDIERIIRRHPSAWVLNYNYFSNIPEEKPQ